MQVFSTILPKSEIYWTIRDFLIKPRKKKPWFYIFFEQLPSSKNSSRDLQTKLSVTTSASRIPVPPAVNCRTTDPLPPFERQSKPLPRHSRTVHRVLHHRRQLKPPAASTTRHHAAWIARSNPAVCSSSTPLQHWPWRKHCLVNNWQDAYKGIGLFG